MNYESDLRNVDKNVELTLLSITEAVISCGIDNLST